MRPSLFFLFYNRPISPKKHICDHALARPYPKLTHAFQLPAPTLPAHLLSSSAHSPFYLSLCHLFQTRCDFEYIFDLINSWCSALQLLLTPSQTATNW
ncbi:unnamed protein product [Hymenolepis diminuta]|uniref:Uncharacterized protein n=1 Tax=Hymenolepis diminuta TaxID=6216 RepID=A0A564YY32_HYMDI|nr:unnamed protein product [Hymenolepis diminuta]